MTPCRPVSAARARPGLGPVAGAALILLAGWLLVGPVLVDYPFTADVRGVRPCEQGLAVIIGLAGIWRLLQARGGRVVAAIGLLGGLTLVLSAFTLPSGSGSIALNEVITGALMMLAGVASADRRA